MAQKYADVDAYLADLEERPAAVVQLVRRWAHEEIPGAEGDGRLQHADLRA